MAAEPPDGRSAEPRRVAQLAAPAVAGGIVVGVLAVSTAAVLIRLAVDAEALAVAFWRTALGAVALAPFAARSRRARPPLDRRHRRQLVASGLFLAVHFALFVSALDHTSVASAGVLVAMAPLFVGVGSALFLREPPTVRAWVGIALATAGAVGIGVADVSGSDLARSALLGDALAFGAAAAVAGYLLIGRAVRANLPVTEYAATVYAVAAVALLAACLLTGTALAGYGPGTWLAIAGLVVGPQLLGHTVFNGLLSTVTATVVAVVVLAEPVGATVLAFLVLDEAPAPGFWLAAPPILLGVFLAATSSGGRRRRRGG